MGDNFVFGQADYMTHQLTQDVIVSILKKNISIVLGIILIKRKKKRHWPILSKFDLMGVSNRKRPNKCLGVVVAFGDYVFLSNKNLLAFILFFCFHQTAHVVGKELNKELLKVLKNEESEASSNKEKIGFLL